MGRKAGRRQGTGDAGERRDAHTVKLVNDLLLERPVSLGSTGPDLDRLWAFASRKLVRGPPGLLPQVRVTQLRKLAAIRGLVNDGVRGGPPGAAAASASSAAASTEPPPAAAGGPTRVAATGAVPPNGQASQEQR